LIGISVAGSNTVRIFKTMCGFFYQAIAPMGQKKNYGEMKIKRREKEKQRCLRQREPPLRWLVRTPNHG
jgi:hypothetical protein